MGTKKNPSKYDAYTAAYDDEPIFTLRANDPLAANIVLDWSTRYANTKNYNFAKWEEARAIARDMQQWREDQIKLQADLFHRYKRGELVDVQDHVKEAPVAAIALTPAHEAVLQTLTLRNASLSRSALLTATQKRTGLRRSQVASALNFLVKHKYIVEYTEPADNNAPWYSMPMQGLNNSEGGQ